MASVQKPIDPNERSKQYSNALAKALDLTGDAAPDHLKIHKWQINALLVDLQGQADSERFRSLGAFLSVYLPKLYQAWLDCDELRSAFAEVLNFASDSLYFIRFTKLSPAETFARTQIKRLANWNPPTTGDPEQIEDDVGGACQFTSTLLVYQGTSRLDPADVALALPKLQRWRLKYRGRFAAETSDRVYLALKGDPIHEAMTRMMKQKLGESLYACGKQGCTKSAKDNGDDLKQCGRCKSVRYCSEATRRKHGKRISQSALHACIKGLSLGAAGNSFKTEPNSA
ncbi:hypothetical protein FRB93_008980 [Tulasnella sp. JGI-2019a]|nr:hypothetical protein FRB93_008980 [Tulasnella sp. JGI-2019a]